MSNNLQGCFEGSVSNLFLRLQTSGTPLENLTWSQRREENTVILTHSDGGIIILAIFFVDECIKFRWFVMWRYDHVLLIKISLQVARKA